MKSKSLKKVPEYADDGLNPSWHGSLHDFPLRRLGQIVEPVRLRLQPLAKILVVRHQAHLRLQIAVHRSLPKVRGADEREVWQSGLGQVIPQSLGMVRPAGLLVLEEVDAVVLLPANEALVEALGYQGVSSRNATRRSFSALKSVCLEK